MLHASSTRRSVDSKSSSVIGLCRAVGQAQFGAAGNDCLAKADKASTGLTGRGMFHCDAGCILHAQVFVDSKSSSELGLCRAVGQAHFGAPGNDCLAKADKASTGLTGRGMFHCDPGRILHTQVFVDSKSSSVLGLCRAVGQAQFGAAGNDCLAKADKASAGLTGRGVFHCDAACILHAQVC